MLPTEALERPLRPGFVAVWFEGEEPTAALMAQRLVASKQADSCMTAHWFNFGLGRDATDADGCTNGTLAKVFADSKGDLKQLLLALVQSDAFFFKGGLQ